MNEIRERILSDTKGSIENYVICEHRDLIAFCISSEYFESREDINHGISPDFTEIIAAVDKEWLFSKMEKEGGIKNPRDYLINEYNSDDSITWFNDANYAGMLAMIMFG